jgi:hypothetical protein
MSRFEKGDVLRGRKEKRGREEAYHRIVFIDGSDEAPRAVVLTRSDKFSCNFALSGRYIKNQLYFIAHLIQKMAEWGPYEKEYELTKEDLCSVEKHISDSSSITWSEYEEHTKKGRDCPDHKNTNA